MIDPKQDAAEKSSTTWRLRLVSVNEAISHAALLFVNPASEPVEVEAEARGPRCEYATTLAARYRWIRAPGGDPRITAYRLEVPESCLWEPAHPFLYSTQWANCGDSTAFVFGFRTLALQKHQLLLNNRPFRVHGIQRASVTADELKHLHALGCNFLHCPDPTTSALTDRLGPMLLGRLEGDYVTVSSHFAACGPKTPSICIWEIGPEISENELKFLHGIDRTSLFARASSNNDPNQLQGADLFLIKVKLGELTSAVVADAPWIAIVTSGELLSGAVSEIDKSRWQELTDKMENATRDLTGCVGWIVTES